MADQSPRSITGMTGPAAVAYRATWGRVFPLAYDLLFQVAERAGMRQSRSAVAGKAEGTVLEIGAGTGLNLNHYQPTVTGLTVTEPDPGMARHLRSRTAAIRPSTAVVEAPGENLPFPDGHFDTVVATLVLCTVPDPARTVNEIARVLRPGGTFRFAEHIRSADPRLARWQDRLHGPWWWFGCGCHCNRDTLTTLRSSPLSDVTAEQRTLRGLGPLVAPLVIGTATRPHAPTNR